MKTVKKAHNTRNKYMHWTMFGVAIMSALFYKNINTDNTSFANVVSVGDVEIGTDVVSIGGLVKTNIVDSTPAITSVSLNCSGINWSGMIPVNDIIVLENGEYSVEISTSPTFVTSAESSGYRAATSYIATASLSANQDYYYRLRARDPARPTEESQYSATVTCHTSGSTPPPPASGGGGGSSVIISTSSSDSITPPVQPMAPTILPPPPTTEDNALEWAKIMIVDPFIGKGAIDLSIVKNKDIIYITPQSMPKKPNDSLLCSSSQDAIKIVTKTKEGIVGLKPEDSDLNNILYSYLNEQTKEWEFIPTYTNKTKKTLDFRAMGIGTYKMTKITDTGNPFIDIKPDDWFQSFAENVRMMKINSGDGSGKFMGNAPLRRGEAYAMLEKAFGTTIPVKYIQRNYYTPIDRGEAVEVLLNSTGFIPPTSSVRLSFSDIKKSSKLYPYIVHAFELDIIKGFNDNTFRPSAIVTRAEMTKIIIKAMEKRYLIKTISAPGVRNYLCGEIANSTISMHRILGGIFTITRQ